MKKSLLYPVSIVFLLAGCGPEEKPGQIKSINESLERANEVIEEASKLVIEELREMTKDPQTVAYATGWSLKADQVHQFADSIRAQIKDLKSELMAQSDSLKRDYVTVVKQLYDVNGVGVQLLSKLIAFKASIPSMLFPEDVESFKPAHNKELNLLFKAIPLLPGYQDSLPADEQIKHKKKWLDESFGRSSSLMAMVMLNKIDNDVLTTEKILVDYCNSKISIGCGLSYSKVSAIGVISSSYVKKGQPLEVTAGMGSFSSAAKPTIVIDGKEIKLNEDGTALYKFTATGNPGKHTVPVKFEYTKPDGSTAVKIQMLEYVIADEK